MLESQIQSKLIETYENQNQWVLKIIKANKDGIPDLLLIDKDTAIASWVEVKQPNGVISPKQKARADELREFCKVRFVTIGDIDLAEPLIEIVNFF